MLLVQLTFSRVWGTAPAANGVLCSKNDEMHILYNLILDFLVLPVPHTFQKWGHCPPRSYGDAPMAAALTLMFTETFTETYGKLVGL